MFTVISSEDRNKISLLKVSEFERINYYLFPLKSSRNYRFSGDFKGNKNQFAQIHLTLGAKFRPQSQNSKRDLGPFIACFLQCGEKCYAGLKQ